MTSYLSEQTQYDFSKAHSKAWFHEIAHLLTPEETKLISLNDAKSLLRPKQETYIGLRAIPIEKIVGSEGRYKDFDNRFFPRNACLRERWRHVDEANLCDVTLPPISVYELAGLYFVRDGNHRVSVAKARKMEYIDAEIVSLQSEIRLSNVTSLPAMIRQILKYEKRTFYGETYFGDITDFWGLDFSVTGQYDIIYNHILTHKYFLNLSQKEEIPLAAAIESWFTEVYHPIIAVIRRKHLMRFFPQHTESDLYVWLIWYWDDLKKKYGNELPLDAAAEDFENTYRVPFFARIKNSLQRYFLKKTLRNAYGTKDSEKR